MNAMVKVTPTGRLSLPAEIRKRHGLGRGGAVIIDDTGDAIILRTVDEVVARAQSLTRKLLTGKEGISLDAFLTEKRREAASE